MYIRGHMFGYIKGWNFFLSLQSLSGRSRMWITSWFKAYSTIKLVFFPLLPLWGDSLGWKEILFLILFPQAQGIFVVVEQFCTLIVVGVTNLHVQKNYVEPHAQRSANQMEIWYALWLVLTTISWFSYCGTMSYKLCKMLPLGKIVSLWPHPVNL